MKPHCSNQRSHALTLTEVLVVIVVLAVVAAVLLPALRPARIGSHISCASNLRQIAVAYQFWAGDNNGKYPMQVSTANGGTMELAATGNVVATFQIMSYGLNTPKLLICPADTNHFIATNFSIGFNEANISYFVGLDADTNHSQAFLSGDDNFAIGGFPVKSGLLELSTNTSIAWTAARHVNQGNIGLADGSVQSTDDKELIQQLIETGLATNRLALP